MTRKGEDLGLALHRGQRVAKHRSCRRCNPPRSVRRWRRAPDRRRSAPSPREARTTARPARPRPQIPRSSHRSRPPSGSRRTRRRERAARPAARTLAPHRASSRRSCPSAPASPRSFAPHGASRGTRWRPRAAGLGRAVAGREGQGAHARGSPGPEPRSRRSGRQPAARSSRLARCSLSSVKLRGAYEQASRRRAAPPAPRPACGGLELGGHPVIGELGGCGTVPRPPVGVTRGVARGGQCCVRPTPVGVTGALVDGRANERMAERDLRPDLEQPSCLGGRDRVLVEVELASGPPDRARVASRLGCRDEQEAAGSEGEARQPDGGSVLRVSDRSASGSGSCAAPASCSGDSSRPNSTSASGFPRASASSRARTWSASGPSTAASKSSTDAASESGPRSSDGSPSNNRRSSIGSRTDASTQTRSAYSRRARNPSASALSWSNHCVSSTTISNGPARRAAVVTSVSAARPTRN